MGCGAVNPQHKIRVEGDSFTQSGFGIMTGKPKKAQTQVDGIGVPDTSIFTAARHLCELAKNRVTLFDLNKLLYFVQLAAVGRYNRAIFKNEFELRENGPVSPDLNNRLEKYGDGNIDAGLIPAVGDGYLCDFSKGVIQVIWDRLGGLNKKQLGDISHSEGSAWKKLYEGENMPVSMRDIKNEYIERVQDKTAALTA